MVDFDSYRPDHEELQLVGLWGAPFLFPPIATLIYAATARELGPIALIFAMTIVIDALGLFIPLMIAGWWCGRWSDRLTERLRVSPYWVLLALVVLLDAGVAVGPWWVVQVHDLLW
ncbi:hypothetical protein [Planctellipticum variicoloris]|uniref:hypothetical protein n=1 Tax=Planctellipticum variicoloris TaxID=3064265 RepID=UPI00301341F0|nr:hypothetical protein SH412_004428 [Planctomycetaceae bacterium SH412]